MKELDSRALGALGEDIAAAHLVRRGYRIVDRNVRADGVEMDIIASKRGTIVFVEVKTRRGRVYLSVSAEGKSILFNTGTTSRPLSMAVKQFATLCASTP